MSTTSRIFGIRPVCIFFVLLAAVRGESAFAELLVDKNPLDLGVLKQELSTASAVFVLTNSSPSDTIIIDSVKTSCGCSQATVESHTIPPKGSTKLTVVLDLTKVDAGPFRKSAYVLYGKEQATEQLELRFAGSVVAQEYYLAREVNFGAVRKSGLAPKAVSLTPYLKGARLQEVTVSDPLLLVQPLRDPESGDITATIAFKEEGMPYGGYKTYMILQTSDANRPHIKVPVSITLLQPQLFEPESLYLSADTAGEAAPRRIAILLENSDVLSDLEVTGLPDDVAHTIERDDASRPTHIVLTPPVELSRNIVGVLKIACSLNGEPRSARIPYYIRGLGQANRR